MSSREEKARAEAIGIATRLGHVLSEFKEVGRDLYAYCLNCFEGVNLSPTSFSRAPLRGVALAFHCRYPARAATGCRHCGAALRSDFALRLCNAPGRYGPCEK